jgi:hypothetical protein
VREQLVVGDRLGAVPDDAPMVPLQADLVRLQRRLRLKPEAGARTLELDLRKDTDRCAAGCCTASTCSGSRGASCSR